MSCSADARRTSSRSPPVRPRRRLRMFTPTSRRRITRVSSRSPSFLGAERSLASRESAPHMVRPALRSPAGNIGPVTIGANADSFNSNSLTFTILPISQTITWMLREPRPGSLEARGPSCSPRAQTPRARRSPLRSSTTGVCTVSGSTVTMVTAGTCAITPTAAALGNYALTNGATSYITINKITQTVAFYTNSGYGTQPSAARWPSTPIAPPIRPTRRAAHWPDLLRQHFDHRLHREPSSGRITFVTAGTCTVTADAATTTTTSTAVPRPSPSPSAREARASRCTTAIRIRPRSRAAQRPTIPQAPTRPTPREAPKERLPSPALRRPSAP